MPETTGWELQSLCFQVLWREKSHSVSELVSHLCRLQRQYANLQLNCTVVEFNTLSKEFLAAKEVTWLIQSVSDYTDAHSVLSISMMKTLFFKLLIPTRYLSCVTHCITFLCCSYLPHLSESYLYFLTFSIIM